MYISAEYFKKILTACVLKKNNKKNNLQNLCLMFKQLFFFSERHFLPEKRKEIKKNH